MSSTRLGLALGTLAGVVFVLAAAGCEEEAPPAGPRPPRRNAALSGDPATSSAPAASAASSTSAPGSPSASAAAAPATSASAAAPAASGSALAADGAPTGSVAASAGPSPSSGPAATATAAAGPGTPSTPAASASPAGSAAAGPAPVAFEDFGGPAVKPPVAAGQRAWAVVPVTGGWEAVKIALLPVTSITETGALVDQDARRYLVPGAFLAPAVPSPALAVGDPVVAGTSGTRVFGRVVAVQGNQVDVRFKFAGKVETRSLARDEVVEIEGKPFLGAPVTIRDRDALRYGQLVHQSAGKTWVVQIGGRARMMAPHEVEVLPAPPAFAVGDEVLTLRADRFAQAVITRIVDERLQYEVKWPGSEETSLATYDAVLKKK